MKTNNYTNGWDWKYVYLLFMFLMIFTTMTYILHIAISQPVQISCPIKNLQYTPEKPFEIKDTTCSINTTSIILLGIG